MTWIETCTAPDLTHLPVPVIATYILNLTFGDRGGHDNPQVRSYLHSFILSTDKALRAYNSGRALMFEYVGSKNRTTLLFHALGEFETCITTVRRALLLAERMAAHPENPEIERTQRRLFDSYQRAVGPVRDAIEHMDDDIARGELRAGEPQILAVSKDGGFLEIGSHRLTFASLSSAVAQLHALSLELASRERSP